MNRQYIKTLILCLLSVILCVTTCVPAFASVGDRTLMHFSAEEQGQNNITSVLPMGDGFCVYYRTGSSSDDEMILRYADAKAEPEKFSLKADAPAADAEETAAGGESPAEAVIPAEEGAADTDAPVNESIAAGEVLPAGEDIPADEGTPASMDDILSQIEFNYVFEYITCLFSWKNELYALVQRSDFSMEGNCDTYLFKHVKLENGKAVTEDCDLPEPDVSSLMRDWDEGTYFSGISDVFVVGDTLVGSNYGDDGRALIAFDLNTGYCTEYAIEDFVAAVPGPEGSVLIQRQQWNEADLKNKATVTRLSLEDQNEETVLELEGGNVYSLNICYDQKRDILYYVYDGELWAVPQMDREQAVSVNECPEAGNGAICLPDGFLVMWTGSTVLLRNTDPAQRSSTTLRVDISGWNTAATDATYAMSEQRGDIAVLLKAIDAEDFDMVQAMMNRDSYMDIYTVYVSGRNFNALLNRGFIVDLSGNEQIAADTERMYPFIRDAVKRDGMIVGVPLSASGSTIGLNARMWKKMGGTEEELPKTWGQFFDWLETLPEKLTDGMKLVEYSRWMNQDTFRSYIRNMIMNQYQIRMEERGEENFVFNTPLVSGLLKRLYEMDLDALGVRDADESEAPNGISIGGDNDPLLTFYYSGDPGDFYSYAYVSLPLSFEEGEEPIVSADISLAILNPYSEHQEEAILYLTLLLKNMSLTDQYAIFTDKTEAIPYAYYTDIHQSYEESVKTIRENIQNSEGEEKAQWEEILREQEEQMENMEEWGWQISPKGIDNYKVISPLMKAPAHSFMEDIMGSVDGQDVDTFYEQLNKEKDVEKMLDMIDSKLQMVRMEGH